MATTQKFLFLVDFSLPWAAMAPVIERAAAMFSAKASRHCVLEPSASGFELLTRTAPEQDPEHLLRPGMSAEPSVKIQGGSFAGGISQNERDCNTSAKT